MLKVSIPELEGHYNEADQTANVRFSFGHREGDTVTGLFPLVLCRDYLHDILHLEHHDIACGDVFGFAYDGKEQKIDRDKLRLIVQANDPLIQNIRAALPDMMRSFEEDNNYDRLVIEETVGELVCLVLEADSRWLANAASLDSFTILVRLASYGPNWDTEVKGTTDAKFFEGAGSVREPWGKYLHRMEEFRLAYPNVPPCGRDAETGMMSIHSWNGIGSLFGARGVGWSFDTENTLRKALDEFLAKIA